MSNKYNIPFEEGEFFHVYNKAIGKEKLFITNENYRYFLQQLKIYLLNSAEIYAYCLIPNHFHLLIKVMANSDSKMVSEQFRKFLISYAKSFNKEHNRSGGLFEKHLKRIKIRSQEQLLWITYYIHRNPIHHHITSDFNSYEWSSFNTFFSDKETDIMRYEALEWFTNKGNFMKFHYENLKLGREKYQSLLIE